MAVHVASATADTKPGSGVNDADTSWLYRFHCGDRTIIEEIYRKNFTNVSRAVAVLASAADRETAIHEIFLRLLSQESLRRSFRGGDLGNWLSVVAHNHAVDRVRRRGREIPESSPAAMQNPCVESSAAAIEARIMVERFRREVLPDKWRGVFEARFIQQLSQEEAAAALGIARTTLAYQEARVRGLLRNFLLR
jgi:RNA polymerase sigma-70 factor, ECF subfamily